MQDNKITMKKIKIGNSDFTRKQLEEGVWTWGTSAWECTETIRHFEREGYVVKFETSILRKIFCIGKFKIVAYPKNDTQQPSKANICNTEPSVKKIGLGKCARCPRDAKYETHTAGNLCNTCHDYLCGLE